MMNEFEITMARIEVLAPNENDGQVRITFQIDGASRSFPELVTGCVGAGPQHRTYGSFCQRRPKSSSRSVLASL